MRELFLLTSSYPFDKVIENTFVEPELELLKERFDITIVPLQPGRRKFESSFGVKVNDGFALSGRNKKSQFFRLLATGVFWKLLLVELFGRPDILFSKEKLSRLCVHLYYALTLYSWLKGKAVGSPAEPPLYYTYWFEASTTALCLFKKENPRITVVSRAHGFDLYEGEQNGRYIPFRAMQMKLVDRVFCISESGAKYLSQRFPTCSSKITVSPIGIADRGVIARRSQDGAFRIVSCSFIVPLKRVDLIIRTLAELGRRESGRKIVWCHIGGGGGLAELEALAKSSLGNNVEAVFLGNMANDEIFRFYAGEPLDLFINLSSSEGRPVSIMEAMNCGIPVLATDVGGVSELVRDGKNGVLVEKDASCEEIAEKIVKLMENSSALDEMGKESRRLFLEDLVAEKNLARFCDDLESAVRKNGKSDG